MRAGRRQFLTSLATVAVLPRLALGQGLDIRPLPRPAPDPRQVVRRADVPGRVAYALTDGQRPLALGQAASRLAPASTMKAITALYALDRLGPTHRFRTRLIRAGDLLVLAGGGDPVFSTDDLGGLADRLAALGGPAPARFAVWGGALPHLPELAPEQDDHLPYNPSMSGMILNFNRVYLDWRGTGTQVQLTTEARAARLSPRAYSITARPGDQTDPITYLPQPDLETWLVSRAALRRPGSLWLPVRLPELYAGDVFQTLSRARGLVLPAPEVIDRLPQGQVVAHHDSPPVVALIRDMLDYSTNITAEALGLHVSGARDLAASGAAMQAWLDQIGQGMVLADHSGLSAASAISPFAMTRILSGPGRDLGLAPLLRQDDLDGARVAAKTGTLNFVSNLAGYISLPDGRQGMFAIFCSDPDRRQAAIGQQLPDGVAVWTRDAKAVQRDLLGAFAGRLRR